MFVSSIGRLRIAIGKVPKLKILQIYIPAYFFVIFYLIQIIFNWPGLRISNLLGWTRFEDLKSVMRSAECYRIYGSNGLNGIPNTDCIPYQYSIELIKFINLSKMYLHAETIAFSLTLILLFSLLRVAYIRDNFLKPHVNAFIFASPGIWLLLERGNVDIFIVGLILLSAYLLRQNKPSLALLTLLVSAYVKFYTLPLILFFVLARKFNIFLRMSAGVLFIVSTGFLGREILNLKAVANNWNVSFGLTEIPMLFDAAFQKLGLKIFEFGKIINQSIGLFILLCIFGIMIQAATFNLSEIKKLKMKDNNGRYYIHLLSGSTFLICYLAGQNYDYRLIFLALSIVTFPEELSSKIKNQKLFFNLALISLWCSCFLPIQIFHLGFITLLIGSAAMVPTVIILILSISKILLQEMEK